MERTTRKDVQAAFDRLATMLGKPHSADGGGSWKGQPIKAQPGWWELDYAACYGGWTIHEIANEGGGVRTPMGDARKPAREFVAACRFAARALEAIDA